MLTTVAFPWQLYAHILEPDVVAGLAQARMLSRQLVDDPHLLAELSRNPNIRLDVDAQTSVFGGFLEYVYVGYVLMHGAIIHVADATILPKLAQSRLPEAFTLGDAALPYPAMEIRFGDGTPAVCVCDFGHPHVKHFVKHLMDPLCLCKAVEEDKVTVFTQAKDPSKADHFIAGKYVDPTAPFLSQVRNTDHTFASSAELSVLESAFTKAVFALMLAREAVQSSVRTHGVPPGMARALKRRSAYRVLPPKLYSERGHVSTGSSEHTGKTVRGHLRMAHYRILLDKRYKRRPDGRPQMVEVRASIVNGGGKVERRV